MGKSLSPTTCMKEFGHKTPPLLQPPTLLQQQAPPPSATTSPPPINNSSTPLSRRSGWARKRFSRGFYLLRDSYIKIIAQRAYSQEEQYPIHLDSERKNQPCHQCWCRTSWKVSQSTGDRIIRVMHILVFPIKAKPSRKRVACSV